MRFEIYTEWLLTILSSGIWRCVAGLTDVDVSEVYIAFFFNYNRNHRRGFMNPGRRRHNVPSKLGDPLTPLHIRTSKKTIFNHHFSVTSKLL
jgi:hypothetical protein